MRTQKPSPQQLKFLNNLLEQQHLALTKNELTRTEAYKIIGHLNGNKVFFDINDYVQPIKSHNSI